MTRMFSFIVPIQLCLEVLASTVTQEKEIKPSFFVDNMTLYVENPKESRFVIRINNS